MESGCQRQCVAEGNKALSVFSHPQIVFCDVSSLDRIGTSDDLRMIFDLFAERKILLFFLFFLLFLIFALIAGIVI